MSIVSKISATSSSSDQAIGVIEKILSAPQHKVPIVTFSDNVAFTKVSTDKYFFNEVSGLDTRKFD